MPAADPRTADARAADARTADAWSLVRALERRVAALAALSAAAGAAVGLWLGAAAASGTAAALGLSGAWLARRWMRRQVVAPLDDLGERLRAEQAQRARVEKLATVGHMAAGIAHEVGNPLAAINGYAYVLRGRTSDTPGTAEVLDALERECARIDRIVRGLLDYARPRRVTPTAVAVNDVLAAAVSLLADQGVLRRVSVRQDLDPTGPAAFGERHELEQVFVNLLLNAADAMDRVGQLVLRTRVVAVDELRTARARAGDAPGEYAPHRPNRRVAEWLSGAAEAPSRVVHVVVADSGPGVAAGDEERVFDPFFSTKQPTRLAGGGTGLGLAIVARIVDALGGAVWVQRAREGGAAFVIVLPLGGPRPALAAVGPGSPGDGRNVSTPRASD